MINNEVSNEEVLETKEAKEGNEVNNVGGKIPAKRVDIVSLKMVREGSVLYKNRKVGSPDDAVALIQDFLEDADREKFVVAYLNNRHEPTAIHTVSIGTLSSSLVHPREVMKAAILSNAKAMLLSHNHPSGWDVNPSNEDINITKRLVEAGKIIGIEILDHVIIGENGKYYSFKEEGRL